MNREDIELLLLAALPVPIPNCEPLYAPTVREVVEMGEGKYNQLLSVLLFDKNSLPTDLSKELSHFEVFFINCYCNPEFRQIAELAFRTVFKAKTEMCDVQTSADPYFYFANGSRIDRTNFDLIQEVVRIGNHVRLLKRDEDQYNPADEVTAKVIAEMLARKKARPKPKPDINLHSMISALSWKSGKPLLDEIMRLSMYQFYDGYRRVENLDSIHYTLFGIYTGNIDAKKMNLKDLHIAKIIDHK